MATILSKSFVLLTTLLLLVGGSKADSTNDEESLLEEQLVETELPISFGDDDDSSSQPQPTIPVSISRHSFPDGFIFGTAAAAYQIEGEANKSCRGPSVWDTFAHDYPERIHDGSNGDFAIDFYHRYKEDIKRIKEMNFDAFRFSISWSRVFPHGRMSEGVNQAGVDFYHNVINEVIANGLEPFVTIFHWDTPQALEDKYGGFLSPNIVDDFREFAEFCFKEFGDRVKYWITVNEPWTYSTFGYDLGIHAPGRCTEAINPGCEAGDSGTEPYLVVHHMLLAHAEAVKIYREKYQASQKGKIGISLISFWFEPYSNSLADLQAAKRALDFMLGWNMDPITYGQYPRSMQKLVGDRLPKFTEREKKIIKGSYDFVGINYYTAYYVKNNDVDPDYPSYNTDPRVFITAERNGTLIGPQAASDWLFVYPKGIRYLMNYTKDIYRNPTIYVTENGVDEANIKGLHLGKALKDCLRVNYYQAHLQNLLGSIKNHEVDVRGYFTWSIADNYEWARGYTVRFGLYYVDYEDDMKRHPKDSVKWFRRFLKGNSLKNEQSCTDGGSNICPVDEEIVSCPSHMFSCSDMKL